MDNFTIDLCDSDDDMVAATTASVAANNKNNDDEHDDDDFSSSSLSGDSYLWKAGTTDKNDDYLCVFATPSN